MDEDFKNSVMIINTEINNTTIQDIVELNENYEKRILWDPIMKTYEELKTFDDDSILFYYLVEVGFGV